jgi:hypothetical protein
MTGEKHLTAIDGPPAKSLRLAVVHWLPLEQFPPACNALSFFAKDPSLLVCCAASVRRQEQPVFGCTGVEICRAEFPAAGLGRLVRIRQFIVLFWLMLRTLIRFRPQVILYFEPHTAPVVFLYLLWNRSARLFIHYHEYRELSHYRDRGNAIARLGHLLECGWLFQRCEWISHTNPDRVRMFLQDNPLVPERLMRTMPNYPPAEWLARPVESPVPATGPLRLVYVGAVSLQDTFIREVAEWVAAIGESQVTLDIYAGSTAATARDYLLSLQSPAVRFHAAGVPYSQLPAILNDYDVGLILYRGTTRNYIYNAPNKLFEYLLCGLEVWYPMQMLGIRPIAEELQHQQVQELDFTNSAQLDALLRSPTAKIRRWYQTCSHALQPLRQALLHTSKGN